MNFRSCRKSYERILTRPKSRHNQFALVALGNLHWKIGLTTPKTRDDNYKRAGELFAKALELKPGNLFAANGLGIVLALKKMWTDSRDIFLACKQESGLIDLWINLAIAYLELGQYASSMNCVDYCLTRASKSQMFELIMLKAKCYFCQGKNERNEEVFEKALKELTQVQGPIIQRLYTTNSLLIVR